MVMLELGAGFTAGGADELNREWGVGAGWTDGLMDGVDVHVIFDLGRWTIYEDKRQRSACQQWIGETSG